MLIGFEYDDIIIYIYRYYILVYIYIYGHRHLQGLPFLILEGGDAIEIFTTK